MNFANYVAFQEDRRANGIEYAAQRSARLGFDSVEFFESCLSTAPKAPQSDVKYVKSVLEQNGLQVACYSLMTDLTATSFDQTKDMLAQQIEYAAGLGAPCLHHTIAPSLSIGANAPSYALVLERALEPAIWIAECCATYGLTCLYEPQGMYFNGVEGLNTFYQQVKKHCNNVKICGDVGNSLFVDVSPNAIYDAFIEDIRHVHVKDYLLTDQATENQGKCLPSCGGKWLTKCPIGEGSIDLSHCAAQLKKVGYDFAISFEIAGDDQTLMRALRYVQALMR